MDGRLPERSRVSLVERMPNDARKGLRLRLCRAVGKSLNEKRARCAWQLTKSASTRHLARSRYSDLRSREYLKA